MAKCNGCGSETAYRFRIYGDGTELCNECGGLGNVNVPDVFFNGPYRDPHLVDYKNPDQVKNGVLISSRREKAELMRRFEVREAGDKKHGARAEDRFAIRREQDRSKQRS